MRFLGVHPTQDEINNIINEYDLDGDGHIDFSEYKQIYMAYFKFNSEDDHNRHNMRSNKLLNNLIKTETV